MRFHDPETMSPLKSAVHLSVFSRRPQRYVRPVTTSGDLSAESAGGLEAALRNHAPALKRFLSARTGDPDIAEDLLQELWIRCRTSRPVSLDSARAYLFRMANNLVLDRAKAERRRLVRDGDWATLRDVEGHDIDPARPDAAMMADDPVDRLADAITRLPPGAATAFRMNKLEGLKQDEVATRMGISRSGVEKHIALAMARLRLMMTGED